MRFLVFLMLFNFALASHASTLNTKLLSGTLVLNSSVSETKAIEAAQEIAKNKFAERVLVRSHKTSKNWAIVIEYKHEGTKKSFRKVIGEIEASLNSFFKGKEVVDQKFISSSTTVVK